MGYMKKSEIFYLSSVNAKKKIPIFDVLYNHQYNLKFLTINSFKKKNKLLVELHKSIIKVSSTLVQGIIICESFINEIDTKYL